MFYNCMPYVKIHKSRDRSEISHEVIKLVSLSMKFILLINVKMPKYIVGILTFISEINTTSAGNIFIILNFMSSGNFMLH